MSTCADMQKCGRAINGRARTGWIKAHVAGEPGPGRWFCSLPCLIRGLDGAPIAQGRPDVATCPLCINRHDRDHRCGVCNTQPQIVRPAPRPIRLFDHAQRDLADTTRKESA